MTVGPKICPYCNSKDVDAEVNPIFAGLSTMEGILTDIPFWKCKCKDCGKEFGVDMLGRASK